MLTAGLQQLTALTALPRLQHLTLGLWVPAMEQRTAPAPQWRLPGSSTWARLTALTCLDLQLQRNVTDTALQDISCLTALRELQLCAAQLTLLGLDALRHLQQLRMFALSMAPHIALSTSTTPALLQLPHLAHLHLQCWRSLQPAFLAELRQLQHLQLDGLRHVRCSTGQDADVLQALPHLTALTALRLACVLQAPLDLLLPLNAAAPQQQQQQQELMAAACAALTASPQLQSLTVIGADLPAGTWLHVFPAGRQLPQLQQLQLSLLSQQLSDHELSQLVTCCPGLTGLTLLMALPLRADMQPLLQLPALQELELQHVHGKATLNVLAQLTGLRKLVGRECSISPRSLMPLTVLRQLTSLQVGYRHSLSVPYKDICLQNQVCVCGVYALLAHMCSLRALSRGVVAGAAAATAGAFLYTCCRQLHHATVWLLKRCFVQLLCYWGVPRQRSCKGMEMLRLQLYIHKWGRTGLHRRRLGWGAG
jgi:hypothetical protein